MVIVGSFEAAGTATRIAIGMAIGTAGSFEAADIFLAQLDTRSQSSDHASSILSAK